MKKDTGTDADARPDPASREAPRSQKAAANFGIQI
jgi:hypothetical protein